MPCPGPFHFSYSVDYMDPLRSEIKLYYYYYYYYIYDFCPLPDPYVGLSIFVCDVEHTSFHFGLFCSPHQSIYAEQFIHRST